MEFKSKRHEEYVEDFIKNKPIVECIYSTGGSACEHDCPKFYDCWCKEKDLKEGNLEKNV